MGQIEPLNSRFCIKRLTKLELKFTPDPEMYYDSGEFPDVPSLRTSTGLRERPIFSALIALRIRNHLSQKQRWRQAFVFGEYDPRMEGEPQLPITVGDTLSSPDLLRTVLK